jgi:hypothetical protein
MGIDYDDALYQELPKCRFTIRCFPTSFLLQFHQIICFLCGENIGTLIKRQKWKKSASCIPSIEISASALQSVYSVQKGLLRRNQPSYVPIS